MPTNISTALLLSTHHFCMGVSASMPLVDVFVFLLGCDFLGGYSSSRLLVFFRRPESSFQFAVVWSVVVTASF